MTQLLPHTTEQTLRVDPRDLARRVVAGSAAIAGLAGILAGRPLLAVLWRAGAVGGTGLLAIACVEAIVRRAKRRVVR